MQFTPKRPPIHLFTALGIGLLLTACGGGGGGSNPDPSASSYTVTTSAGAGGSFDRASEAVDSGNSTSFTVTADTGYGIDSVSGCDGSLSGNTYTTGPITADCSVSASFAFHQYSVTATAGTGGSFNTASATVDHGSTTSFTVTPDIGYSISSVSGCGGSLSGNTFTTSAITADCSVSASFAINQYQVLTFVANNNGGGFDLPGALVNHGSTTSFTLTADTGYSLGSVSGCGGSLSGNTYTTAAITSACTVSATFAINQYTVTVSAGANGSVDPGSATVNHGSSTSFTVTPDSGYHINSITGCGGSGSLSGTTYTTGTITANCTLNVSFADGPASAPQPTLSLAPKQLQFSWPAVGNTHHYRILENPDGASGFTVVSGAESITTLGHNIDVSVHKLDWVSAEYLVEACNADNSNCQSSSNQTLTAADALAAIGYFKASNTDASDLFGYAVALSADGNTLAVGAYAEDSAATGINGVEVNNTAASAGAVYVFVRGENWSQQAYIKASNTEAGDAFGQALALSADGNTLAVGAKTEDSAATGVNFSQSDNTASGSGAVYVFTRNSSNWSQQAYVKASNTQAGDNFGTSVSLASDGNTLAVGARREGSAATGVGGNQSDNTAASAGAAYVFSRTGTTWTQQAYVKASNTGAGDFFGYSIALSGDGSTLAVGADLETSSATGINGDESDNSATQAGAVYVFALSGSTWSQQAYVKASNTDANDFFGYSVSLSSDGSTLAVGAFGEGSAATGINGDQTDNSAANTGAAYIFSRSGTNWSQQAYIKAFNSDGNDRFGIAVALSGDGGSLAVGAHLEDSAATGVNGDETDNSVASAGAVYMFSRSGSTWSQQSYVKESNTSGDLFGISVSLSSDGASLAVGGYQENSAATGIGGDQTDDTATNSGAVYLY